MNLLQISASHVPVLQRCRFKVFVKCFWCLEICLGKEREHPSSLACLQPGLSKIQFLVKPLLVSPCVVASKTGYLLGGFVLE